MMLEVVAALIVSDGRLLLTQRRADQDYPYCWESPGGKVEGNESHHEALRRELREELGVEMQAVTALSLWRGSFKRGEFMERAFGDPAADVFVLLYAAQIVGVPKPMEGQGIGWFTAEEVLGLKLMPANLAARGITIDYLASLARR